MGKRNMRVRNVQRTANGGISGFKSEACDAVDVMLGNLRERDAKVAILDHGALRQAFRSRKHDNVVYKVCHTPSANIENESEFRNMLAMARDPETHKFHTPTTLMYVDGIAVIVMVLRPIDGNMLNGRQAIAAARKHGIGDMHPGNYRGTPSGRVKITDAGDVNFDAMRGRQRANIRR